MIYDYIIIGAGIGGLSAGLNLATNRAKVLMLEKNSLPGGLVSTIKKGRFEFDTSVYDFYNYGASTNPGTIQLLFNRYGLDIATTLIESKTLVSSKEDPKKLSVPASFDDFMLILEELEPNSMPSLQAFLKVIKEIHEALQLLEVGNEEVETTFKNFAKYLGMNTLEALNDLKMPSSTIERLTYLWVDLASPINKLSFIDFAEFMYRAIFKRPVVLTNKSQDLIIKLVKKYQSKGGKIYFNSEVTNISREDNYCTLTTSDNHSYKAKHIICNQSPRYVYSNLCLPPDPVFNQIENARSISPNGFVVYLGLNQSAQNLKLTNYKYYHYHTLNSEANMKKMQSANHDTFTAIVPNIVNPDYSPKNTCVLILKTIYFGDVFTKLSLENYHETNEELAKSLITKFEEIYDLDITPYIEEMAVLSPLTIKRYTNNVNGSMYGYQRLGYDNSIHRFLSFSEEQDPLLSFVGGSSLFGAGVDNAFYSGYYISEKLLKEKGEENEQNN